jgi:hypothetical protein
MIIIIKSNYYNYHDHNYHHNQIIYDKIDISILLKSFISISNSFKCSNNVNPILHIVS